MSRRIQQNRKSSPSKQHLGLVMGAEGHRSNSRRDLTDGSLSSPFDHEDMNGHRTLNSIDMTLARKNTFKKRYDLGELTGANLVINRKSLN